VRTSLSVALGAVATSLLSHSSMVRKDFTVTAATCAAVAGSKPVP
jgi:hypothetical protein